MKRYSIGGLSFEFPSEDSDVVRVTTQDAAGSATTCEFTRGQLIMLRVMLDYELPPFAPPTANPPSRRHKNSGEFPMTLTEEDASALLASVREAGKELKELSTKEARLVIIRDALACVSLRRVIPEKSVYLETAELGVVVHPRSSKVACHACALGVLFFSYLDVIDGKAGNVWGHEMRGALSPFFALSQLILIETFFESAFNADGVREIAPIQREETSAWRMRFILTNMLENEGVFVPPARWLSAHMHVRRNYSTP